MADGGGRGHFKTMAEIRTAVADHERRLAIAERDLLQLTDEVVKRRRVRKKRKVR